MNQQRISILLSKLPRLQFVAFDPGKETGVFEYRGPARDQHEAYSLPYAELQYSLINHRWSWASHWVVEEFRVYPRMAQSLIMDELIAARAIGAIELGGVSVELSIRFQSANNAKNLVTDDLLIDLGWWKDLPNGHARDAARHALYYLIQTHMQ